MLTKQNWDWLATGSEYQMAVMIQQLLQENQVMEAKEGLESLIEAMGRNDRRALKSQLIRLMLHIIKWKWSTSKTHE
jgi:Domain of unknown function DUF29.